VVYYTPANSSWLNLVERWFAEITNERIRRPNWSSVKKMEQAIHEYIRHWNKEGFSCGQKAPGKSFAA